LDLFVLLQVYTQVAGLIDSIENFSSQIQHFGPPLDYINRPEGNIIALVKFIQKKSGLEGDRACREKTRN